MNNDKLIELSLHYDTMLWTVTAIFTAAIGWLLVYCIDKFNCWLACIGLFLTLIAVYFAGSFRHLRRRIHARLEKEKVETEYLYTKGLLKQWYAFAAIFIVLIISWLTLLFINQPNYIIKFCWCVAGILSIWAVIFIGRYSDKLPTDNRQGQLVEKLSDVFKMSIVLKLFNKNK